MENKKIVITLKGFDQWAEVKNGQVEIHCPEWEVPILEVQLKEIKE